MSEDRPQYCPRCGAEAPAHGQYCAECGANMVAEAEGAPEPQPDAPPPQNVQSHQPAQSDEGYGPEGEPTMGRRDMLIAGGIGTVALGGGAWWFFAGPGSEAGAAYGDDITESDLLPPESMFPTDWSRQDGINDNFDAVYASADESLAILLEVEKYETVSAAKNAYDTQLESFGDANSVSIGDEAAWVSRSDNARLALRHSNAFALVVGVRQTNFQMNPDVTRAEEYARKLVDHWQSL